MEETELSLEKLKEKVRVCLPFPNDRRAVNAYNIYETSYQSELFLSEEGRILYGEFFDFSENIFYDEENVPTIEEPGAEEEISDETKIYNPDSLRALAIATITRNHKNGTIDPRITDEYLVDFGEQLDIENDLINMVDIDNDTFWKRVAITKSHDKCRLLHASYILFYNWKSYGIEAKLIELIENVKTEDFKQEEYENMCKIIKDYVFSLDIKQLQPIRDIPPNPLNPRFHVINLPPKECHHISLSFLGILENLTELAIQYGVNDLGIGYQKRFFEISYDDITELASALKRLRNLKVFRMRQSLLDDRKLKIILKGLEMSIVQTLEFAYCKLGDDSGKSLGNFLLLNNNIENLELQGNDFHADGMTGLGYGIQNYKGEINYLNLSKNPLEENGILNIGGGLNTTKNVKKLDLSCVDITPESAFRLLQIISFHEPLEDYNISNTPLGPEGGNKLLEILEETYNLINLECRACDLDANQDVQIRILLERNLYYKQNPCMKKSYFTKEDTAEIDEWSKRVKHPILLEIESENTIKRNTIVHEKKYFEGTIPDFIPEKSHKQKSNYELLHPKDTSSTKISSDNKETSDTSTDSIQVKGTLKLSKRFSIK